MTPEDGKIAAFHLDVLPDMRVAQQAFEVFFGWKARKQYPNTTLTALPAEQLYEEYQGYQKHFDASKGKLGLDALFREKLAHLSKQDIKITQGICVGLGRFADLQLSSTTEQKRIAREALHQLVILNYLVEISEIKSKDVLIQDSKYGDLKYRSVEASFLKERGYTIVDPSDARLKMTQNTFAFMPGAGVPTIVRYFEHGIYPGLYLGGGKEYLDVIFKQAPPEWDSKKIRHMRLTLNKHKYVSHEKGIPVLNGALWESGTSLYSLKDKK